MSHEQNIKRKFRILATFYDLFDLVFLLDNQRNPRKALARKIPHEPRRILDVCVGTANSAIAVAKVNSQVQIVGVDLSQEMLAVAEEKISKRGLKNIALLEMDATDLDIDDNQFDVAMISFALHESDYSLMLKILHEMQRVLKDAGQLFIIDYETEGHPVRDFFFSIHLKIFEPRHMPEFLRYDWDEILVSLGFEIVSIEEYLFSKLISATKH